MSFTTRKPTGAASFPLVLMSGVEGAGKTWAAVEASAIDKIDRTFFIEIGEGVADEYGAVPGADFEIIEHDGTIGNIRQAITWAAEQPAAEGKFNMLIVDSLTEMWEILKDNAQVAMNDRIRRKGRRTNGEPKPDMDLWNRAAEISDGIMRQLRSFPGPVIATARLDVVTAMDDGGQPTRHKDFKIQVQKKVPFQATIILQGRQPRVWTMTKIVTTVPELQLQPGKELTFNDFSFAKLFEKMGITADTVAGHIQEGRKSDDLTDDAVEAARRQAQQAAQMQAQREQLPPLPENFEQVLLDAEAENNIVRVRDLFRLASRHGNGDLVQKARMVGQRMDAKMKHAADQQRQQEPPTTQSMEEHMPVGKSA